MSPLHGNIFVCQIERHSQRKESELYHYIWRTLYQMEDIDQVNILNKLFSEILLDEAEKSFFTKQSF